EAIATISTPGRGAATRAGGDRATTGSRYSKSGTRSARSNRSISGAIPTPDNWLEFCECRRSAKSLARRLSGRAERSTQHGEARRDSSGGGLGSGTGAPAGALREADPPSGARRIRRAREDNWDSRGEPCRQVPDQG